MDEVQIEIKDELIHQDEEVQTKKNPIVTSLIEETNILNEEVHIKDEPIDQVIILPSTEQDKSEPIKMKTDLKTKVKQENFGDFESCEQVRIDLITSNDSETPFANYEVFNMKTEVKTEVKEETLETFEAWEQGRIDCVTSKNFDHSFYESEWNKLIKPCYLKLVRIDKQKKMSQISKETGQRKKDQRCNKKFDQNSDLNVHERSCTGPKSYSCKTCKKALHL